MKTVQIISIGKLRDTNIQSLESEYRKRLKDFKLVITELKAHGDSTQKEADEVLNKLNSMNNFELILLSEWGQEFKSTDFSKWFYDLLEGPKEIVFVIGGALGFGEKLLKTNHQKISLSKLTMPHQFIRAVLSEQLYRAQTIKSGHPYHH